MPNYYTGDPSGVTIGLTAAIIGATNASPIVAQTSAPHLFNTGDRVSIAGVAGNTAANAGPDTPWTIQVLDATHFRLVGSTGNGAWTSGGIATDLDFTPPTTLVSDGDPPNASSFNLAPISLADKLAYLGRRMPKYRIVDIYAGNVVDASGIAGWGTVWSTNAYVAGTAALAIVLNALVGDWLEFSISSSITVVGGSNVAVVKYLVTDNGGAPADVPGAQLTATNNSAQVAITGSWIVTASGTTRFFLTGKNTVPGSVQLSGAYSGVLRHWRATS